MKKLLTMIAVCVCALFVAPSADAQLAVRKLTNASGGTVAVNKVVVVSTSSASAFTTTTTASAKKVIGITSGTTPIDNLALGTLIVAGIGEVDCVGAVALGDYLGTSTTAGSAQSNGNEAAGSFALALESGTDTTITCIVIGQTGVATSASTTSIALPDGVDTIIQGDDDDIRYGYDNDVDARWEMNDGTNTFIWVKDMGTEGDFGVTGNLHVEDDDAAVFGTDNDIYIGYDEVTDDRLEITDGTNLLAFVKDNSNEGDLGITGDLYVQDDDVIRFGTDSDIRVGYDETTDDRLEFNDGTNLLAYMKDLGTTGAFGVTGRVETPQIGTSSDTDLLQLTSNLLTVNGAITATGKVTTPATALGGAGLNVPHGTAPSSPTNGDVWTTTSGPYWRVNGTTEKVPMLSQAETIAGNWVNTANPWADNEVVDALTISGGTINNTVIGGSTPAAGTFTTIGGTTGTWTGKQTTTTGFPTMEWKRALSTNGAGVGVEAFLWKADNATYFNYGTIAPQVKSNTAAAESGQISFFVASGGTAATSRAADLIIDATKTTATALGVTGATTLNGATTLGDAAADTVHFDANAIDFEGATANSFETAFSITDPTADRTFTIPDRDSITAMTTNLVRFGPTQMTPQAYGAVYTACDPYAAITGTIIWGMPCLDGVLDAMVMQTVMPLDYNAGTVVVDVYWVTTSSSTNNAQWGCLIGTAASGQDISTATDDYLADPDVGHKVTANAGALKINKTTFSAVSPDHPAAGVPLVVFIGRVADTFFDSGNLDTLAATCYVVGVDVTYTRK